ncbi:MAG: DNA/RNA nuclease SfsA [Methanomassiliicoccaceae archaeon]|nr:DNA/RNA nuclease SfsA [Methanomassiliicoccaceae archaeon]
MRYPNVIRGTFVERPNRFVAYVDVDGRRERCHVKNTGRCKELLVPGAEAVLSVPDKPGRATGYDLIGVYKGGMLVNIDSQAPNSVVEESIRRIPGFEDAGEVRREHTHGDSRFDIFARSRDRRMLMEVKGVTLEEGGVALFPDAPTERGLKHVRGLRAALGEGYEAYVMFLVQMSGPKVFSPHYAMHEEFALEVERAHAAGVRVLAYDSVVTEDAISLGEPIEVRLGRHS